MTEWLHSVIRGPVTRRVLLSPAAGHTVRQQQCQETASLVSVSRVQSHVSVHGKEHSLLTPNPETVTGAILALGANSATCT